MGNVKTIVYIALIVLGFIILYLFGIKNQKLKNSIQSNGIETIGTVVNRFESIEDGGITTFAIHFDFYINQFISVQCRQNQKRYLHSKNIRIIITNTNTPITNIRWNITVFIIKSY